ncbi:MAG: hypothetical protein K8S97_14215, partial [Anaerolineae bacterium]|nr:hypothetical protein [Anaerolineae bacterium]
DPAYTAVAAALDDPALADTGNLLSVIVMPGAEIAGDPLVALLNSGTGTPETQEEAREQLGLNEPRKLLPPYELAAFATSHDPDASWLTVILTFPADMEILAPYDWAYFRDLLAEKISTYPGMAQSGLPLIDRWTFAHAHALEIDGVAVITATMRVDNPPPPVDGEDYRPYIMRWAELIQQNDLAFLAQMDADTLAGE